MNIEVKDTGPSLDASAFPGARPVEMEKRLKKLHRDLKLKWNALQEHWEVWHISRKGKWYCFHRHTRFAGEYLPPNESLYIQVMERANFTEHGQSVLKRMKETALEKTYESLDGQHEKSDKLQWQGKARNDSNPIYYT
tara:strand:- start:1980 stop:2393 length:414 start_codon:yes stop_codon:yes gene_type:complete